MTDRVTWGGRYATYDEIASGGMATIYLAARLADDPAVPAVVALKKLAPQFAKQPEFVAMFLDEAHLAARIRHPNVVTTYEFLRTDEGLGIVMDLVVGEALVHLVRGRMSVPQAPAPVGISLAILTGALDGLQAAHEITDDSGRTINLVHRDVSPHNIIVGMDGVSRVIDFGVAKAAGRLQTTDVGVLKGKFAYMSPEQVRGAPVDRRTDVYAAGIVLWESLTGRKLFHAKTNEEILLQRTSGSLVIAPPSAVNPSVPPELDRLVLRALANTPGERFGSALAMAETIRADHALASAAEVAAWVKSRAGDKLDRLDARRRWLEQSLVATSSEASARPSLISSIATASRPPKPAVLMGVDIPDAVEVALPAGGHREVEPAETRGDPRSEAAASSPPRRTFGADIDLGDGDGAHGDEPGAPLRPPLRLDMATPPRSSQAAPEPPPSMSRPSLPRERTARSKPARKLGGTALVLVLLLVTALSAAAALEGPALLRAKSVRAALAHGFAVEVDRAELAGGGVRLIGVRGTLAGCPAIRFAAAEVIASLDGTGSVRAVSVPGYELVVVGSGSEVRSELTAWRDAKPTPVAIEGRAGHLLWTRPATPTLVVEGLDVGLSLGAGPEAPIAMDSRGLLVSLPRAHAGPWRMHLESSAMATRLRVGLDPAAEDGPPSATLVAQSAEGVTWALDIPRASTFKAGIPAELFGVTSDLALEVSLRGSVLASGDVAIEGHVGLFGLGIGSQRGPVDVLVSGRVRGDPSGPLAIASGKLAIGNAAGPIAGTLALGEDGIKVAFERPAGHPAVALALDTRDWTTPAGAVSPPP